MTVRFCLCYTQKVHAGKLPMQAQLLYALTFIDVMVSSAYSTINFIETKEQTMKYTLIQLWQPLHLYLHNHIQKNKSKLEARVLSLL